MKCIKVMRLKEELDQKLDQWRKRLLDVQMKSILSAEKRARSILEQKQEKLASEIRLRVDRHGETFKKVLEDKSKKAIEHQTNAQHKLTAAQKFKEEQERALKRVLALARKAAELRDTIK